MPRLVASISAAPRGAPCVAAVPAMLGLPSAIVVRSTISVGLSVSAFAASSAASMALRLVPSATARVCHPYPSKRRRWSVAVARSVAPSIVIRLSSKIQVSLPSLWCPAISAASCEIPSIRSPSEQIAQVRWSTISCPGRL